MSVSAETTTQPAGRELRPILSAKAQRKAASETIDRFVQHVQTSPTIDARARQAVAQAWQQHRNDDVLEDFMMAGLSIVSPAFKDGAVALDSEDYTKTDKVFASLAKHNDPYIALHASALAARSLVEQDRLEEAEKILQPLAAREKELADKTFLGDEVDFLLGYCLLANLRYEEAGVILERFDRQHPNAPDRLHLPARQMLQELQLRRPGRLGDVSDLMVYSGRRLAVGDPGEPVQAKQAEAVTLLSRLIAEAEERECGKGKCKSCGGKGCKKCGGSGQPKGNQPSGSPAKNSILPLGPGHIGALERTPEADPGEHWGKMRPEQRERILQSLRRNFPAQYRQLVEQYYKQLAKEK